MNWFKKKKKAAAMVPAETKVEVKQEPVIGSVKKLVITEITVNKNGIDTKYTTPEYATTMGWSFPGDYLTIKSFFGEVESLEAVLKNAEIISVKRCMATIETINGVETKIISRDENK